MILDYQEFTQLVEQFARDLPGVLASHQKTRDFAPRVQRLLEFAETRFTLAIVGQMRVGKSSLLNALIGAELAVVGVTETTATVNVFTHGTGERTHSFRVHWKGRPPEDKALADRTQWSGESSLALETRKLEFFADTDFLKTADVVDTPGTRSLVADHTKTVDAFLAQKADEADQETRRLGSGADAILYVVPPVARQSDADLLEDFQRTTRLPDSPPHNSLAVVHKWESLESQDPHGEARNKAERIYKAMGDFVSGALSVSAPLGWAAEHYPDSFWTSALDLAANTAAADLEELLLDSRDFIGNVCASCPLDIAARKKLREEFKLPWPCFRLVLRTAREKAPSSPDALRRIILETSGLVHLRQKIQDQFFARARMLKMSKLLATVREPCDQAQRVLRNYKLDVNRDLELADRAKVVISKRLASGDEELRPAQAFINSTTTKLAQDMTHVGMNLRRVGEAVLKVMDTHEQMEGDFDMLDLLDQSGRHLPAEKLEMLRCLLGRAGANVSTRLAFFAASGKTAASIADLEEAIGNLRQFRNSISGKLRPVVDHGIDRLEQIANWMEETNNTNINIPASLAGNPELSLSEGPKRPPRRTGVCQ